MLLVSHVSHVIPQHQRVHDFIGRRPSGYVIILPSLVAIDTLVKGDIMVFVCHVT